MKLTEDEKCPRCGALFTCGKSGSCWCFEVDLRTDVQEAINRKYSSCLCPKCIHLFASNPKLEV